MSAIAGLYWLDGRPVGPEMLHGMLQSMAHRAPDGTGVWHRGPAGLGHGMLRTTPDSLHEKPPAVDASGNLVVTADARIDNREELASALGLTGPLDLVTDSQLIVLAYQKWGEECPSRLLGDFAFAIWDERRQILFCARDHMGVRPFFYHRSGRVFVFGSEIKALLTLPEVPRRLNESALGDYLLGWSIFEEQDKEITLYQDILRLPAGHALTVRDGDVRVRQYWSPDPRREIRMRSDEEYAGAFRELFTEAVRCRLRSAYPVGSMLSGGLDSSSVTCVARDLLAARDRGPLPVFSAVYQDIPESDESAYIEAVIAQGGVEPVIFRADTLSPLMDIEEALAHQDEVFLTPNFFIGRTIYRLARERGIRVVLDGLDGDLVVSHGRAAITELARRGRWLQAISQASAIARRFDLSGRRAVLRRILWHRAVKPLAPGFVLSAWRGLRRRNEDPLATHPIIRRDFAARIGLAERARSYLARQARLPRSAREEHWQKITSGAITFQAETAEREAASCSVRVAHPFFDKRLVEFCLALPWHQKLYDGWIRIILRRALAGSLPPEVCWRPGKADLSLYLPAGLLAHERALLEETATNPDGIAEYVDAGELHRTYERLLAKGEVPDAGVMWQITALALWLKHAGFSTGSPAEAKGATR